MQTNNSSVLNLLNLAQQLNAKLNNIYASYTNNLVTEEVHNSYYKGQIIIWFIQKWTEFKSAAQAIAKTTTNKNIHAIANVKILAYTSNSVNCTTTKGDAFKIVFSNLIPALKFLNNATLATLLQSTYNKLEEYVIANSPKTIAVQQATQQQKAQQKTQQKASNTQYTNMENIVVATINKFPKKLQHEARVLMRNNSNNKLATLQAFITQNNITV